MARVPFESLTDVRRLESAGVAWPVAEAQAELIRVSVLSEVATRGDLTEKLSRLEERLIARIERGEHQLVIRAGAMIAAAVGLIVAAQRLL